MSIGARARALCCRMSTDDRRGSVRVPDDFPSSRVEFYSYRRFWKDEGERRLFNEKPRHCWTFDENVFRFWNHALTRTQYILLLRIPPVGRSYTSGIRKTHLSCTPSHALLLHRTKPNRRHSSAKVFDIRREFLFVRNTRVYGVEKEQLISPLPFSIPSKKNNRGMNYVRAREKLRHLWHRARISRTSAWKRRSIPTWSAIFIKSSSETLL